MPREQSKIHIPCDNYYPEKVILSWRDMSEIQRSALSVMVGNGEPHSSKGPRVMDVLETTQAPANGPTGIRASSHKKAVGSISQPNAFTPVHAAWAKNTGAGIPGRLNSL